MNTDIKVDINKINEYTSTTLLPEEVFCFEVALCDTTVEDNEEFTISALQDMKTLYLGKRGSCGENTRGIIFDTYLYTSENEETTLEFQKVELRALIAIVRTRKSKSDIDDIKNGRYTAVSQEICIDSDSIRCSECGQNPRECMHILGKIYDNSKLPVIHQFSSVSEVYDWNLVSEV